MPKINVFIGHSTKSFKQEANELKTFLENLSNHSMFKAVEFKVFICEEGTTCSQEEINEVYVKNADFTLFCFIDSVGEFTKQEYSVALDKYRKSEDFMPKIFVYFKEFDGGIKKESSILEFAKKLEEDCVHYFIFDSLDVIKYRFLANLQKILGLDLNYTIEKDVLYVNNIKTNIFVDKLPAFAKSPSIRNLQDEINNLSKKINDSTNSGDYQNIKEYAEQLNQKISMLESVKLSVLNIYEQVFTKLNFSQENSLILTALKLAEEGKIEEALKVLPSSENLKQITDNIVKEQEMYKKQGKQKAEQTIESAKARINLLKINLSNDNRFYEIEETYKSIWEIMSYAEDVEIISDYAQFLFNHNKSKSAIEIYLSALKFEFIKESEETLAIIYNNIASVYNKIRQYEKALEYNKKAIEIREKLVEIDKEYESALATSYNNIAAVYYDIYQMDKALEYYEKAIEIYERLSQSEKDMYESALATVYNNIASLYKEISQTDKAIEHNKKAIEIRERLVEIDKDMYESDLAGSYSNIASVYYVIPETDKALEYYKKSIKIYEKLVEIDKDMYQSDLAGCYNNIASVYYVIPETDKALEYYKKSIEIREKLVGIDKERYEPDLVTVYNNIASLYKKISRTDKALEYYKKSIKIYEKLVEIDKDMYEPELAIVYNEISLLCSKIFQNDKALEYCKKAMEIYERLVGIDKERYELDLVTVYNNIAAFYYITSKIDEAVEYEKKAATIMKRRKIE